VNESFSSEIGDPPGSRGDSFSNEFRGASASLIERDRPPRNLDIGRRARRTIFWLLVVVGVLGGGGWALWYWSEEVGAWIASWNADDVADDGPEAEAEAEAEGQADVVDPAAEPTSETPATSGPAAPGPAPLPGPIPGELPVEPLDTLDTPGSLAGGLPVEPLDTSSSGGRVSVVATTVRGRVTQSRVSARLTAVDEALAGCWTTTVAAAHGRPASLTLRFAIKWNGRLVSVRLTGDAPDAVQRCVREALPSGGWPQPTDGGDAQVTREWRLQ
jgi:hypothetical protein